jgi:hypothetical protein
VTTGGDVHDGRCHWEPACPLPEKACLSRLTWAITAKPGFTPDFQWKVDGTPQPDGGPMAVYNGRFDDPVRVRERDKGRHARVQEHATRWANRKLVAGRPAAHVHGPRDPLDARSRLAPPHGILLRCLASSADSTRS